MAALVALGLWLKPAEMDGDSTKLNTQPEKALVVPSYPAPEPAVVKTPTTVPQVLRDCRLDPSDDNDADSFWVANDQGLHRFKLYYADAPDLGTTGGDTQELMRYFNGMTERTIRQLAIQGKDHTTTTLTARPFDVTTRWELDEDESTSTVPTYKAFVTFENQNNQVVNLSALLVRNGFAKIDAACKEMLPNSTKPADYLKTLEGYKLRGQQERVGGWGSDAGMVMKTNHAN
jgi:hypothetical protein